MARTLRTHGRVVRVAAFPAAVRLRKSVKIASPLRRSLCTTKAMKTTKAKVAMKRMSTKWEKGKRKGDKYSGKHYKINWNANKPCKGAHWHVKQVDSNSFTIIKRLHRRSSEGSRT